MWGRKCCICSRPADSNYSERDEYNGKKYFCCHHAPVIHQIGGAAQPDSMRHFICQCGCRWTVYKRSSMACPTCGRYTNGQEAKPAKR